MNIFGYFFQKVHFKALRKKGTQKKNFCRWADERPALPAPDSMNLLKH